jgi:ABC-type transport system involved in multi-copper enzyme maturation permease subunit
MPILTIAALTLREVTRRRVAAIAVALSLVLLGLIAWGFWKLNAAIGSPQAALAADSAVTVLLAFMFSVVLALGAGFLAASSIATDIDGGVALALLPRPISRAEFVFGKWLGLAGIVCAYGAVVGGLALLTIAVVAGYAPPEPLGALTYVVAQSVALLTLALFFSTRLPALAGSLLAVALFGVSWIAGITEAIARALHADALSHAAAGVGLLLPTDGLWRGALYDLTPVAALIVQSSRETTSVNPFGVTTPPPPVFLAWTAAWIVALLAASVWSMRTRDF